MTTALGSGIRKVAARLAPDPTRDGELLACFLARRDEAAFAALVRRHGRMVLGTCRRVLGNSADADDAFQAAFVVLLRKAQALTDRACIGDYLHGIAFHTALKAKAMTTKRRAKESRVRPPIPIAHDGELAELFDAELAELPEKYRGPVVLCDLEGVGRKDAAVRLGIPEGTISSRLAIAHRMLEKRLRQQGFAAVGLAAISGNQTFAVSESLAEAAVQAAVAGPSPAVTQLASEVLKMYLLNKLTIGSAVLAGMVLLLGVGFDVSQPGRAADVRVNVRAPIPKEKTRDDADAIRGTWQVTEWVQPWTAQGLKKLPEGERFNITFGDDTMTYEFDTSTIKYKLDLLKDPKQMQFQTPGGGIALGICELKGDDLKVCIGPTVDPKGKKPAVAPTSFDAEKVSAGTSVFVMKRVKEKEGTRSKTSLPTPGNTTDARVNTRAPVPKKVDDKKLLAGKWVTKSVSFDPPWVVPQNARHIPAHHELTFTDTELTWVSFDPSPPIPNVAQGRSEQTKPYTLNQAGQQKELLSGDMDCIYELDGDNLKVALFALCKGRPKAFNAKDSPPGPNGHVWIIELTREKEAKKDKPAEKKPGIEKKDQDRVQGLWQAESLEANGQKAPAEALAKFQLRFEGDAVTFVAENRTHTFELDASTKPKSMNLTPGDGTDKGKKLEIAIYELDGDTLEICMDKEGEAGKRPTEFKTAPKDGRALMVFKRVKEKREAKEPEKK